MGMDTPAGELGCGESGGELSATVNLVQLVIWAPLVLVNSVPLVLVSSVPLVTWAWLLVLVTLVLLVTWAWLMVLVNFALQVVVSLLLLVTLVDPVKDWVLVDT